MSTTKHATLSYVHAVFKGLQEHVRDALRNLPNSASSTLRSGLIKAHQKLSDYYYTFDESPYYIWAAGKGDNLLQSHILTYHLQYWIPGLDI